MARATGSASTTSSRSTPLTGQHVTFLAQSPHAWTEVSPTCANRAQIDGTAESESQCSWSDCRVVTST